MKIGKYLLGRVKMLTQFWGEVALGTMANIVIMPSIVWATYIYMLWLNILPEFLPSHPLGMPIKTSLVMMLLAKFLMVGLQEETVFRYLLHDRLLKTFLGLPTIVSVFLSSVLFGAAHLMNGYGIPYSIPQAVGAACAGALFGYIYEKRGLHMAILVHGLYDFIVVSAYVFGHA